MTTAEGRLDQVKGTVQELSERIEPHVTDIASSVADTAKQAAAGVGQAAQTVSSPGRSKKGRRLIGAAGVAVLLALIVLTVVRRRS